MGYQNNICSLCGGELDLADYLADSNGNTCTLVTVHRREERTNKTLMVCRDCGLVYAREEERDA